MTDTRLNRETAAPSWTAILRGKLGDIVSGFVRNPAEAPFVTA